MTPADRIAYLKAIKGTCQILVDLSKARTPGIWIVERNKPTPLEHASWIEATECRESDPVLFETCNPEEDEEGNLEFVAACAGAAEAAWIGTIITVDGLLQIMADDLIAAKELAAHLGVSEELPENYTPWKMADDLIALWPVKLLRVPLTLQHS